LSKLQYENKAILALKAKQCTLIQNTHLREDILHLMRLGFSKTGNNSQCGVVQHELFTLTEKFLLSLSFEESFTRAAPRRECIFALSNCRPRASLHFDLARMVAAGVWLEISAGAVKFHTSLGIPHGYRRDSD